MTFKVTHIAPDLRKHQQLVQSFFTTRRPARSTLLPGAALLLSRRWRRAA